MDPSITTKTPTFNNDNKFHLDASFLREMKKLREPWISAKTGKEDVLAALVYYRTYSRNGDEPWYQCVKRIVEGCFRIQQRHIHNLGKTWNPHKQQFTAQEMYKRIFHMKFLPPGRGLWAMGTAIIEEKGLIAALNNCAFVSTEDLDKNPTEPFTYLMDASMLGVGVGIDTKGANKFKIFRPSGATITHVIADSREGWVESVRLLILSYSESGRGILEFDYTKIRPAGTLLKTFGGISAGKDPLVKLHDQLREVLDKYIDSFLDSRGIADICNLIGLAVVSGNIRRTAEILFGDPDDDAFINLKNYELNPERASFGWTSNNSILAEVGMNYDVVAEKMMNNGEPGILWLENAQKYSRMRNDEADWKDTKVKGANPCVEQSLESHEMCNLVETFPYHHNDLKDYLETLRYAFLYAKSVTLLPSHWEATNEVMLRNRRIGTGISGVAQFLASHSMNEFKIWLEKGYDRIQELDKEFSDFFAIPRSIKTTTVKPSGTVSIIASATPGMHYPIAQHYIRRVTLPNNSQFVPVLKEAGYTVETSVYNPETSVVVEVPMTYENDVRVQSNVTMWEQLNLAAFLQEHWSDNQVSATITFDKVREGPQISQALDQYQYRLKGISFLPSTETSDTYAVSGKFNEAFLYDDDDEHHSHIYDNVIKSTRYDEKKDTTFVTFDSKYATKPLIQKILCNWAENLGLKDRVGKSPVPPYEQMPIEPITRAEYEERIANLKLVQWLPNQDSHEEHLSEAPLSSNVPEGLVFCDGDSCCRV